MYSVPCTTECAVRDEFVVGIVALDGDFIKWWCSPRPMWTWMVVVNYAKFEFVALNACRLAK